MSAPKYTDPQQYYTEGFFAALVGVRFLLEGGKVTTQGAIDHINDLISLMEKDGDLEGVDRTAEQVTRLARAAEQNGVFDEFMETLDLAYEKEKN